MGPEKLPRVGRTPAAPLPSKLCTEVSLTAFFRGHAASCLSLAGFVLQTIPLLSLHPLSSIFLETHPPRGERSWKISLHLSLANFLNPASPSPPKPKQASSFLCRREGVGTWVNQEPCAQLFTFAEPGGEGYVPLI